MRILEEFWYGNIEPTEYDTSSCKEYKKLLELICRNEEKLKATMTDEQKELFEKYTDCVREYQTITDCLIFQNSFKLGAKMMLEIMEADSERKLSEKDETIAAQANAIKDSSEENALLRDELNKYRQQEAEALRKKTRRRNIFRFICPTPQRMAQSLSCHGKGTARCRRRSRHAEI